MKRRDFLKGITAIGAISAAPKLISSEEAERILELDNHLYTIGEQTIELDYSGPESPFDRIVEYADNKELTMKLWK